MFKNTQKPMLIYFGSDRKTLKTNPCEETKEISDKMNK